MAVVSLTILNVWLLRFSRASMYRGGNATDLASEFAAYGLSSQTMYVVGIIKVLAALLLLIGIRYSKLIQPALLIIAVIMSGAIYFHISIEDAWIKSLPAALLLSATLLLLYWQREEYKLKQ